MIPAGSLNRRVSIQTLASGEDELGQPVQTWSQLAEVWADIRHPNGLQAIKGDAEVSIVRASVRIRYRVGIDAGMRVVAGDDIYDIQAILPDKMGGKLDLVCQLKK